MKLEVPHAKAQRTQRMGKGRAVGQRGVGVLPGVLTCASTPLTQKGSVWFGLDSRNPLHCNSRNCSQAATNFPSPWKRVGCILFGCGFAALWSLRLCVRHVQPGGVRGMSRGEDK